MRGNEVLEHQGQLFHAQGVAMVGGVRDVVEDDALEPALAIGFVRLGRTASSR